MVMVSGAIGLQKKGGRSPPPKRGRLGGGRCAAAPYKHRLAYAPGNRPLVFRAGVPVRRGLGVYPKSLLNWSPRKVVRPCGERRAHRSGEGCPNQGVGSARLKRRLRPTRRSKSATPAVAVQIMPSKRLAPPGRRTNHVLYKTCATEGEYRLLPKYPPPEAEPYYFVQSDPSDLENRRYYEQHRTGKTKPL